MAPCAAAAALADSGLGASETAGPGGPGGPGPHRDRSMRTTPAGHAAAGSPATRTLGVSLKVRAPTEPPGSSPRARRRTRNYTGSIVHSLRSGRRHFCGKFPRAGVPGPGGVAV